MNTPFLPDGTRPLMQAMNEADTCLHIIRDLLLSIHHASHDPQQVRLRVAEALDQQEAACRLLMLEGGVE